MSMQMTGLRKRIAALRPVDSSHVSELRVLHTEKGEGDDEEHVEERIHESPTEMLHSFSSISSDHSSDSAEDDSEHEHDDESEDAEREGVSNGLANGKDGHAQTSKELPDAGISQTSPPGLSQSTSRGVRRATGSFRSASRAGSDPSSSGGSWFKYDLSIIVALVSPIGNILTGSDHIKNVLLLLLLIYYLHQLVEVPWTLYRLSIPSKVSFEPMHNAEPAKLEAYSELKRLEIFYLAFTVLSPFLGATLLRFVAKTISGDSTTLSWFSTSLFVLATGIRPWSHLTDRLKNRSRALKALIEESESVEGAELDDIDPQEKFEEGLADLRGKYDSLDKRLTDLDVASTRELDDLADAIDAVEANVRKYENGANKKANEWDARLSVLETYVLDLHMKDRRPHMHEEETYMRGAKLRALFWEILALPWTVSALSWSLASKFVSQLGSRTTPAPPGNNPITPNNSRFSPRILETIVEEDPDAQDGVGQNGFVASDSSHTLVAETGHSKRHEHIVDFGVSLIVRFLTIACSPVFFFVRALSLFLNSPRSVLRIIVQ